MLWAKVQEKARVKARVKAPVAGRVRLATSLAAAEAITRRKNRNIVIFFIFTRYEESEKEERDTQEKY